MMKENRDLSVLSSLYGIDSDAHGGGIPMRIENDYLDRERRENLEMQGFDPVDFGFEQRESTGSAREYGILKAFTDMSECESKRIDYDPFDFPNVDMNAIKEEVMEEREDLGTASPKTELAFIKLLKMDLFKAKIRIQHFQKYNEEACVSETFRIEITNNDLEVRRFFVITAKEPIHLNFKFVPSMHANEVISIEKGTFELVRDEETKDSVSMFITGLERRYMVISRITLAEIVDKVDQVVVSDDPWASLKVCFTVFGD